MTIINNTVTSSPGICVLKKFYAKNKNSLFALQLVTVLALAVTSPSFVRAGSFLQTQRLNESFKSTSIFGSDLNQYLFCVFQTQHNDLLAWEVQ